MESAAVYLRWVSFCWLERGPAEPLNETSVRLKYGGPRSRCSDHNDRVGMCAFVRTRYVSAAVSVLMSCLYISVFTACELVRSDDSCGSRSSHCYAMHLKMSSLCETLFPFVSLMTIWLYLDDAHKDGGKLIITNILLVSSCISVYAPWHCKQYELTQ